MKNHYKILNEVLLDWNNSVENDENIISASSIRDSIDLKKFLSLDEYYNDFMPLLKEYGFSFSYGYEDLASRIDYAIRGIPANTNVILIDDFLDSWRADDYPENILKSFEDALIRSGNKISTEEDTTGLKIYPLKAYMTSPNDISSIKFEVSLKDKDKYHTPKILVNEWAEMKIFIEKSFITERLLKIFNKVEKIETKFPDNNSDDCIIYCQGYLKTGQYIILCIESSIHIDQMQYGANDNKLIWPKRDISIYAVTDIISNYQNKPWYKEKYFKG